MILSDYESDLDDEMDEDYVVSASDSSEIDDDQENDEGAKEIEIVTPRGSDDRADFPNPLLSTDENPVACPQADMTEASLSSESQLCRQIDEHDHPVPDESDIERDRKMPMIYVRKVLTTNSANRKTSRIQKRPLLRVLR